MKTESWRVHRLGEKPSHTWDEAGYKFLIETQHMATHDQDKGKLRWLQQYLRGKPLAQIDRELIARIEQIKAQAASPATANRHLALIRTIPRKAALQWEWFEKVPKIRLYKEAKRRVRWLNPAEVQQLLAELPPHQRDLVIFALSTGLRQSNVVKREWSQVDMARGVAWIHPDQAKARRAIHVPLNSSAMAVLARQVGKQPTRVFTYRGRPIAWANTRQWRKALERAGIEDFRWHDLRHTWASRLGQAGTPLDVVQKLGGRESESMVRHYAHLAPVQPVGYGEKVAGVLGGTTTARSEAKKG